MRRTLQVATLLLACAAAAPACLLDGGAFQSTTGSGGTGLTGTGGNTGGTGAGGTGAGGTGGAPAVCGDSQVTGAEKCDDGGNMSGDGCDGACQVEDGYACSGEPSVCKDTCGDGALETGLEQCDDKNGTDGDGCSDCQIDDGYLCSGAPSACLRACGNGVIDTNDQNAETCDDANVTPGDGCEECAVQPGWDCTGAPSTCSPLCGDMMVAGAEKCDDGAGGGCKDDCSGPNPGYACDPSGVCTPVCGDGSVVVGEGCEDGNTKSGDGCSSVCQLEATCGNGIIEPGEVCDGGPDCVDCATIDAGKTCGKAVVVASAAPGAGGVITTTFEGDTTVMPTPAGDIPPASCFSAKKPKLLVYTTGDVGSIVTLETKPGMVGGTATFGDTVVWAYRDCLGKADEELCSDDIVKVGEGTPNLFSKGTTGYLPPQTALYIVVAGTSDANSGKFILDVREQPVTLLFGQTFTANLAGLTPSDVGGDGKSWAFCDAGGCGPNSTMSASGKGYALADDTGDLNGETLGVSGLPVAPLGKVFVQYNFDYSHKGGANDSFVCTHAVDGGGGSELLNTGTSSAKGRKIHDVSASTASAQTSAVQFKYIDGGNGNFVKLDDVYVYGF